MEETHPMEHPGRSRVSSGNPEAGPGKKRSEYELTGENNLPEHQQSLQSKIQECLHITRKHILVGNN